MMNADVGVGADRFGVAVQQPFAWESARERTMLLVRKWDDDQVRFAKRKLEDVIHPAADPVHRHFLRLGISPYETVEWYGNLITEAGWTLLLHGKTLLSSDTAPTTFFDSTHGRIGVGTGTTAATAADTALGSLSGMTGNNWALCGAAPTVTTTGAPSTVVFTGSFTSAMAVGAWNEFAIDQGVSGSTNPSTSAVAPMLNHSASSGLAGTKASGQVWSATATLSFT